MNAFAPNVRARLAAMQQERDALDAEIAAFKRGIEKAAYDACMAEQLLTINASRALNNEPPLSMTHFLSGQGDA